MGVEPPGEKSKGFAVQYFIRCMKFHLGSIHTRTCSLTHFTAKGSLFMKRENIRKNTIRITLTAVFLGLALVVKSFLSFTVPIFGGNGLRIGFAGIFNAFPAFLFGPLYGGIASGLSDLLGYLIKPDGAYIPLLSVSAFCGGVIKGLIWNLFRNRSVKRVKIVIAVILAVITVTGGAVWGCLRADGVNTAFVASSDTVLREELVPAEDALRQELPAEEITQKQIVRRAVQNLKEKEILPVTRVVLSFSNFASAASLAGYINLVTLGPVCVSVLGFLLLGIDSCTERKRRKKLSAETPETVSLNGKTTMVPYVRIFLAIFIAGLFVTTVNTVILKYFLAAWANRSFWILLIPRLAEEILISIVQTYFISLLYGIYEMGAKRFH